MLQSSRQVSRLVVEPRGDAVDPAYLDGSVECSSTPSILRLPLSVTVHRTPRCAIAAAIAAAHIRDWPPAPVLIESVQHHHFRALPYASMPTTCGRPARHGAITLSPWSASYCTGHLKKGRKCVSAQRQVIFGLRRCTAREQQLEHVEVNAGLRGGGVHISASL